MKSNLRHAAHQACQVAILVMVAGFRESPASAQLAITEAMSQASTNFGPQRVTQNSDYWELTNFSTNTINLTGYKWNDNAGGLYTGEILIADPLPFVGLSIGPLKSIIFVQSDTITDAQQFRDWWGVPACRLTFKS